MNNKRRAYLKAAVDMIRKSKNIVEYAQEEEQDALDNLPENLEDSERYSKMENAADSLSDACDALDEAIGLIEDAVA